jgi:prepilin-type N-terminal cleavage/methylation domain-containing protein
MFVKNGRRLGFSLVELVIVIVIIGIIAAIAIPRVSRGAKGASDSALRSNLAVLRSAIEMYASEHGGTFPGASAAGGSFGAAESADAFKNQILNYTDATGAVSDTKDTTHIYGPYLRKQIPPLPVGANKGSSDVTVSDAAPAAGGTTGWVYSFKTGEVIANCADTEKDDLDTAYNQY